MKSGGFYDIFCTTGNTYNFFGVRVSVSLSVAEKIFKSPLLLITAAI